MSPWPRVCSAAGPPRRRLPPCLVLSSSCRGRVSCAAPPVPPPAASARNPLRRAAGRGVSGSRWLAGRSPGACPARPAMHAGRLCRLHSVQPVWRSVAPAGIPWADLCRLTVAVRHAGPAREPPEGGLALWASVPAATPCCLDSRGGWVTFRPSAPHGFPPGARAHRTSGQGHAVAGTIMSAPGLGAAALTHAPRTMPVSVARSAPGARASSPVRCAPPPWIRQVPTSPARRWTKHSRRPL